MDTTDPSGDYYLSFQSDGVMSDSTWASYSVGSHHKHQQVKGFPTKLTAYTAFYLVYSTDICHQFLNISYKSNSEYWSQKCIQNGSIHSFKLDVYAAKQSTLDLSFNSPQRRQGKKTLSSHFLPLATPQN